MKKATIGVWLNYLTTLLFQVIFAAKYGAGWTFSVDDGAFFGGGGRAVVYRVEPVAVFGFSKGDFAQTRWRFLV